MVSLRSHKRTRSRASSGSDTKPSGAGGTGSVVSGRSSPLLVGAIDALPTLVTRSVPQRVRAAQRLIEARPRTGCVIPAERRRPRRRRFAVLAGGCRLA